MIQSNPLDPVSLHLRLLFVWDLLHRCVLGLLMAVVIGICIGIVFGLLMLFGVFIHRRM